MVLSLTFNTKCYAKSANPYYLTAHYIIFDRSIFS